MHLHIFALVLWNLNGVDTFRLNVFTFDSRLLENDVELGGLALGDGRRRRECFERRLLHLFVRN